MKFRSIRGRLSFYIIIVILLVTSLRIGVVYFVKSQNMMTEMTDNINALVDIGSNALKRPLWDFDLGNVEDVAKTLILDVNVSEVVITDQKGNIIIKKIKLYEEQTDPFLSRRRQIFFNDQYIGNIMINFTDQFYEQKKYSDIFYEIFLGLLEISFLGWIVLWISSMITKPLLNLTQIADNIAKGNLDNKLMSNTADEIGTLENTILSMQNQLKAHIDEIELNHDEIQALYEETSAMNEELETLVSTLDKNYQETITALANAIEASDSYTRGHCDRVQKYAMLIADKIGMNARDKRNLHMAAILHDIGKIGVPMEILNKETPLTVEEMDHIKRHSEIGYQIMRDIEFLSESAQIVLQHHERYDGKGYNNGLSGESILLSARIIGIADAYDAMTSSRAYRKTPLTHEKAVDEIVMGSGTQFDGMLVDAFLEVLTFEA
ncbi:HD domain-containing phosphohydrolase [Fusibacter ferrireducens]|uniref:HD domain-containing protein n=1 Tax=Fusibacter ferrireducens TaxID=2785058 RepID=A0ABR9ZW26_9FIRM|nr:HD domain-containing phosphohydrolase [Fusibacter ferrireducens]MBF4694640.1 HD domain-containing protein [Fusibacter ferrireducens]